ncbi:MAG: NAD(P)-dependent oxidoreductase [Methanoregula sp.]|nr:NAD(P)-dependent oxidoreductase [Methanoregula sp.]
MKQQKIAITIRSFGTDPDCLEKLKTHFTISYQNTNGLRLSEEELAIAMRGAHGVIAGTERYTEKVIRSSADLKVISRVGVGTDNIDKEAARKAGISIVNTPIAPADAVAEHTLTLILCCLKNICRYNSAARIHNVTTGIPPGLMLKDKVCGIIGMGRIGKRVAVILLAFGCKVIYFDPYIKEEIPEMQKAGTLDEIIAASDILTLHTPSLKGGERIISRRTLPLCKEGVIIINTARGSLIDEEILIKGLKARKIRALGLDVFVKEPYSGPLENFPEVIMTPHIASNTVESRGEMEREAVQNLISALRGRES